MSKIGIFGGAFDPPHIGHIQLAVQAKKELKLTEVIAVPTAQSPFGKKWGASFEDRLEMLKLAFGETEGFTVSDIEKDLKGSSYTINTLRALKERYSGKNDFYLLIGGDQLFNIEKWYRYEALLKECHVTAVTRGGISYTDMQEYSNELGRIKVLNLDIPDISSTEIREKLKNGEDITGLVPDAVKAYINDRGLYCG